MSEIKDKAYYEALDKRSKEYRDYKDRMEVADAKGEVLDAIEDAVDEAKEDLKNYDYKHPEPATQTDLDEAHAKQSKGLGDDIEKITKATGIKAVIDLFTPEGKDCGCDKRRDALNERFKHKIPLCLNLDEYQWLTKYFGVEKRYQVTLKEQEGLLKIHNRLFEVVKPTTNCSDCVRGVHNDLEKVMKIYND